VWLDDETTITLLPTFPLQGERRLRVLHPIARGASPQGKGFPPSPMGALKVVMPL